MANFPLAGTEAEFDALTREGLLPGVTTLIRALGHDAEAVPFKDGSLPVYAVGDDLVLKLYPQVYRDDIVTERTMLEVLHGKLPIPTPRVEQAGEHDGWGYLLMERLPGRTLKDAWPDLSTADKQRLMPELGEALAALHAIDDPELDSVGPKDWTAFISAQREKVVEYQRAAGLDDSWLSQIPAFLDAVDLGTPTPVPLHTEFMREHLMVTGDGEHLRLTGLFDFEPAMRGAAEYEFVAAGVYVTSGDTDLLRRLLLAYGYSADQLGEDFARRCLAYTLLHVYSNFRRYLEILPAAPVPTLDAVAITWFATSDRAFP